MIKNWMKVWGLLLMACLAPALAAEKGEKPQLEDKTVAAKPFELVSVSTDRKMQDAVDYERVVSRLVPLTPRFSQLWTGDAAYRDTFGKPVQRCVAWLNAIPAAAVTELHLAGHADCGDIVIDDHGSRVCAHADRVGH